MLPYAIPVALGEPVVFREGPVLVVPVGVRLPAACVKCGGDADEVYRRRFYWHHPAVYLSLVGCVFGIPGLLLLVILALVFRRSVLVEIPLCGAHARRRRYLATWGWAGVLAGLGMMIGALWGAGATRSDWWADAFMVGAFVSFGLMVVGAVAQSLSSPLRPRRITKTHAYLTGAGEAYLDPLPSQQVGA